MVDLCIAEVLAFMDKGLPPFIQCQIVQVLCCKGCCIDSCITRVTLIEIVCSTSCNLFTPFLCCFLCCQFFDKLLCFAFCSSLPIRGEGAATGAAPPC